MQIFRLGCLEGIKLAACLGMATAIVQSAHGETEIPFDPETPHHLSLVLAGTSVPAENATAFTLGADYEYRLTRRVGLGAVVEHAFGDIDATTALAVADIHLWRGLATQIGPGVEIIDGDVFAAGRIGMLYEIELENGITLSPQVHYDIAKESSIVFGIAIGRAF
ncbi:MAG: hypothetical protein AAGK23_04505 [Pseudomonadota bacterium]